MSQNDVVDFFQDETHATNKYTCAQIAKIVGIQPSILSVSLSKLLKWNFLTVEYKQADYPTRSKKNIPYYAWNHHRDSQKWRNVHGQKDPTFSFDQ